MREEGEDKSQHKGGEAPEVTTPPAPQSVGGVCRTPLQWLLDLYCARGLCVIVQQVCVCVRVCVLGRKRETERQRKITCSN